MQGQPLMLSMSKACHEEVLMEWTPKTTSTTKMHGHKKRQCVPGSTSNIRGTGASMRELRFMDIPGLGTGGCEWQVNPVEAKKVTLKDGRNVGFIRVAAFSKETASQVRGSMATKAAKHTVLWTTLLHRCFHLLSPHQEHYRSWSLSCFLRPSVPS